MGEFAETLTIKIKVNSGASDAAMHDYGEVLVGDIKNYLENLKYDSWRQEIHQNWEDSHSVELEIEIKETNGNDIR